jgi:hypothetical protein
VNLQISKWLFFALLATGLGCARGSPLVSGGDAGNSETLEEEEGDIEIDRIENSSEEEDDFVYPKLEFKMLEGSGSTASCTKKSKQKDVTATMGVVISRKQLEANLTAMKIDVGKNGSDAQREADAESQKSLGKTTYHRPSASEIKSAKEDDDDWLYTTTAIFANKIVKEVKNLTFEMDPPIPVYGFPTPLSRYKEMEDKQTWKSKVKSSAHGTFDVVITLQKVRERDEMVTMELTTKIIQDQQWEIYEDFPVPVFASFTINTKEKDIRSVSSRSQFLSDSSECAGVQDTVESNWTLCSKEKDGEVEQFCN